MQLRKKDRELVVVCFRKAFFGHQAGLWAYGSRVKKTAHEASDLDLVVVPADGQELPASQFRLFQSLLQESSLPFLTQVQNWSLMPASFRQEILRNREILAD